MIKIFRRFFGLNLTLHPILKMNKNTLINKNKCLEAMNLSYSLNNNLVIYDKKLNSKEVNKNNIKNLKIGDYVKGYFGYGWVDAGNSIRIDFESDYFPEFDEKILDQNEMEYLVKHNTIILRSINNLYFFNKSKLNEIVNFVYEYEEINDTKISSIFINYLLSSIQIKNIQKAFNKRNIHIEIYDRFSLILKIFQNRSTSRFTNYQTKLALLQYTKTLLKYDKNYFTSLRNWNFSDLFDQQDHKLIGKSHMLEGEKLKETQKRIIQNLEKKLVNKLNDLEKLEKLKIKNEFQNNDNYKVALVL